MNSRPNADNHQLEIILKEIKNKEQIKMAKFIINDFSQNQKRNQVGKNKGKHQECTRIINESCYHCKKRIEYKKNKCNRIGKKRASDSVPDDPSS